MEKVVRKLRSWEDVEKADFEYGATLSGNEKLAILIDLLARENGTDGVIQKCVRNDPLGQEPES